MIGGVSGEVIDVGVVRIHLKEMGGAGADTPTDRVVAHRLSSDGVDDGGCLEIGKPFGIALTGVPGVASHDLLDTLT